MKRLILVILILVVSLFCYSEKVAVLNEIMKPSLSFAVDGTQLYIPEEGQIFIYSTNDYKLVKKFGKAGEGPQEFRLHPRLPMTIDASGENSFRGIYFCR